MTDSEDRAQYVKDNRHRFAHYAAGQRDKIKADMIEAYGGKCLHCGESDQIVLTLDHINDDARIEIERYGQNARGGHKQYQRLKREGWPKDRFQLLCFNCNAKKEHKRRRASIDENWGARENVDRVAVQAKIGIRAHNTSGFKGVFWSKQRNKWTARIMLNYKSKHLGFFNDIVDAARAYNVAAFAAWGENANLPTEEEILEIAARIKNPVKEELSSTLHANLEDMGL